MGKCGRAKVRVSNQRSDRDVTKIVLNLSENGDILLYLFLTCVDQQTLHSLVLYTCTLVGRVLSLTRYPLHSPIDAQSFAKAEVTIRPLDVFTC